MWHSVVSKADTAVDYLIDRVGPFPIVVLIFATMSIVISCVMVVELVAARTREKRWQEGHAETIRAIRLRR